MRVLSRFGMNLGRTLFLSPPRLAIAAIGALAVFMLCSMINVFLQSGLPFHRYF
ncbi:secreted protein [gut metagenome]|uniref:Secreted protein n=1 Tax=gut metagenome TaxID=749906 RepID=J9FMH0_9ZZZZ